MNLVKKASPWVVASLMATASAFAQSNSSSCPQTCPPKPKCSEEMKPLQLMAAYNAPARIEVRGCWDVYASASFTYWQPSQSNLELGYLNSGSTTIDKVVSQDFGYKPGFQVALGMNFDHDSWDSKVQYTWFRGSERTKTEISDDFPLFFSKNIPTSATLESASQTWKLHMDLLDWDLGRSYFVGTKLNFRTAFGARAAWLRQNLNGAAVAKTPSTDKYSFNKQSHSWAIGPRAAVNTNWAFGDGFRIFGNTGADLLYTRYSRLDGISTEFSTTETSNSFVGSEVNAVRTHMDMELGLGWGSYFDCNNWHVDLTVGYGFQVFFEQNMFRNFPQFTNAGAFLNESVPNGNLSVHGLTATARFDF